MRIINSEQFKPLLKQASIKPKLHKDVRFKPLSDKEWLASEYIAVPDRSQDKGILLIETSEGLFATPYELTRHVIDKQTGRSKPITCDFCCTWQGGSNAARITFVRQSDNHSLTFLCCADLACSRHVRGKTQAALLSRTHIQEDLTPGQRIQRLSKRLSKFVADLQLSSVETS